MQLELIRSSKNLDVLKESHSYQATKGACRTHIVGDDFVYIEFSYPERPSENLPYVRVAFDFEDAMGIIDMLAEKGDSKAQIAKNACHLAFSIADFAKESS